MFEDKRGIITEMLDVIKSNLERNEALRRMFIREAPNFGNYDDYVDLIAKNIHVKVTGFDGSCVRLCRLFF